MNLKIARQWTDPLFMKDRDVFLNHYKCGHCGNEWDDVYECRVDDDCTSCGSRHYTPVWSAGENADYQRFLFVEPDEDSEGAYGPFKSADDRDIKAAAVAAASIDRRVIMLDLVHDDGTIVPVIFPYQKHLLESPGRRL